MIIAVASGKGGTGKTTVSVSLALSAPDSVHLLDCDVEEPNAALFFAHTNRTERNITVPVPVLDEAACISCGACASFCEFNAIVHIGTTVMIFPELCHSCGGCVRVCPSKALQEEESPIGVLTTTLIERSGKPDINFVQGLLSIGKAMSPPVIRAVKKEAATAEGLVIIDAPPGTSCPMTTAVKHTEFIILVTEPTPFGLHDLNLAVQTVHKMGIPCGVIINRSDSGDSRVVEYCTKNNIEILMQIPQDRKIAEGYSRGEPLVTCTPEYARAFEKLARRFCK